ncbi:MAG: response regulator transcription factor [Chloroflexi bacterium]|nr:response regulator transcription factor [Chloroflexota bacterium]
MSTYETLSRPTTEQAMASPTILIVDDEANIVELNRLYIENAGYTVVTARDGIEALTQFRAVRPALIVLDLMMPEVDGWEVCRRLRQAGQIPIIMLTARAEDVDRIVGLELGADDYMTKPYNPRELVARIRAVLRRAYATPENNAEKSLSMGDLVVDPARREAKVNQRLLQLRTKEFDLLYTLLKHQGLVLSREQLLELVWGFDYYGETRTVDMHIAQVRKELQGSSMQIETVWGVGYKLVAH